MVAVPETAGVHWQTRSGEVPELPQLPPSALVPLVVPPKVPPWAGRTVGLLQLPASAGTRASPWQAATPSRLQRPSTLLRQARGWPPAPTHAAISSPHAFRHCRATEAASAASARYSAASSVSSDVNPRAFGRCRIVQPPQASPSRAPGQSAAGGHVQPSNHPQALCGARGCEGRCGRGPAIPLTRFAARAPNLFGSVDPSTLATGPMRTLRVRRCPADGPRGGDDADVFGNARAGSF